MLTMAAFTLISAYLRLLIGRRMGVSSICGADNEASPKGAANSSLTRGVLVGTGPEKTVAAQI